MKHVSGVGKRGRVSRDVLGLCLNACLVELIDDVFPRSRERSRAGLIAGLGMAQVSSALNTSIRKGYTLSVTVLASLTVCLGHAKSIWLLSRVLFLFTTIWCLPPVLPVC